MVSRTAIFFTRAQNDLDHIVPILYRWAKDINNKTILISLPNNIPDSDFRLEFVRSLPNTTWHRLEMPRRELGDRLAAAEELGTFQIQFDEARSIVEQLVPESQPVVFVFDHGAKSAVRSLIIAAKDAGIRVCGLAHGDQPFANKLITLEDLAFDTGQPRTPDKSQFDIQTWPNHFSMETLRLPDDAPGFALGSPRFCPEWLGVLDRLLEPVEIPPSDGCLKLLLFPRNEKFALFQDEFHRMLEMLLGVPRTFIGIMPHTRLFSPAFNEGRQMQAVTMPSEKEIRRRHPSSHLHYFEPGSVHSSQLVRWADAVLSLGTSISFEAVMRGIPVFEIEYLHPNRTVLGQRFANADIQCRDDILKWVLRLHEDPGAGQGFYPTAALEAFRREMVSAGSQDVLAGYVSLLSEHADRINLR